MTNSKKSYTCLLCHKDIDDDGDNFCSRCRVKDWKLRFIAIQHAEHQRIQTCKYKNSTRIINDRTGKLGSYYEKRREL